MGPSRAARLFSYGVLASLLLVLAASAFAARDDLSRVHPALRAKYLKEQRRKADNGHAGKPYDAPAEAMAFFNLKRSPDGKTPVDYSRYRAAKAQSERMPRHSSSSSASATRGPGVSTPWTPLGPGNIGGRTRAIVIDPGTPTTMYAGGVAGGVWKTTNEGTSWVPLMDSDANLAVSSLAMNPANSAIIYAGTGEGFFNLDAARGGGIFRTIDSGANWDVLANTSNSDFHYVNDMFVSKADSDHVHAATREGIFRSTNGGANWTQILSASDCMDLAFKSDAVNDYGFATCGNNSQSTIYRNTDADGTGTWSPVHTESDMARTSLAIAPSDQNYVYALSASSDPYHLDELHKVFRSTNSGDSWPTQVDNTDPTELNTLLLSNALFSGMCAGYNSPYGQGWYDNVIAVDPMDKERVWAGGIDLFRSDDGGENWGLASHWWGAQVNVIPPDEYAHADQHAIVFDPGYNGTTNRKVYVGNDGGLFRSDDATAALGADPCEETSGDVSWTNLNNGYGVTQFYNGTPYPNGTTYFGGTQDNGTVRGADAGGIGAWEEILSGDGGYVAVDPTNTDVLYAENYGLSIQKSPNGGGSFGDATNGITDSGFLFITPFVMDPNDPNKLWTGGSNLYRTADAADDWDKASTSLGGSVSAIAVAPGNGDSVVAGLETGEVVRNTAATLAGQSTSWPSDTPRANAYVSSVAFDAADLNHVYATYSTFGGDQVFKSTDGGANFTSIQGNLPDIPVHDIVVIPDNPQSRLYIGTDLGVYFSADGGTTWAVENTGFAHTVTETLKPLIVGGQQRLYAFTHGRGAYRVDIPNGITPPPPPIPTVSIDDATVLEVDKGSVVMSFRVHLSQVMTTKVSVRATTADGTALSAVKPKDFGKKSKVIRFKPGETEKFLVVKAKGDLIVEPDETFTVGLTEPVGITISDGSATGTITNDDP